MAGYTRQSTASIINGSNITAPPLNAEFNQVAAAFNAASGHGHTGGTGDAPKIPLSTSVSGYLPAVHGGTGGKNKFDATSTPAVTNDGTQGYAPGSMWENTTTGRIYVCVGNSTGAAVWRELVQVTSGSAIIPSATDTVDLGDNNTRFQDLFLSGGMAAFGNASLGGTLNVTSNTGVGGTLVVTGATTLAATSATSLSVSGTATLAAVDINNGNIDNTQIGATNPSTGAFTSLSASGTSTLTTVDINNGTIDNTVIGGSSAAPASFTTINATGNITGNLVGNVTGNITASGSSTLNNLTVNGTMDVTNTQIANVSTPTNASHAANKSYVDAQINNLIGGAPSTLDTLNEIADALNDDANVYNTLDTKIDTKLSKAGDTMSGDLAMGANKVTGLATPTTGTDAVNLTYVTNLFGSTSSAASSASAASTSESNAASSATAAAASYDSFDDRYIGPKTGTLPSVDNDGNALVVGALVFDATNNVMKVWNGSEFQAASSSIDGIKSNFKYTATANQTSFLGADANGNTLVIDNADLVNVFMNGVRLIGGGSDYTASANVNTVTLTAGATASDVIEIEVFGNFTGQAGSAVSITGGTVSGLTSLGVAGDATFGDNNKAIFGAGSDLSIFHNGSASIIEDSGTGGLTIRSNLLTVQNAAGNETVAQFLEDGFVKLFHNNSQVFTTISTGASITGSLGIGTSLPTGLLDLSATTGSGTLNIISTVNVANAGNKIAFFGANRSDTDEEMAYIKPLLVSNSGGSGNVQEGHLAFGTSGNEAMRLDASGALLVDTTDVDIGSATSGSGFSYKANNGALQIARQASTSTKPALVLNTTGVDSSILDLRKDGSTVGSIGVNDTGSELFIEGVSGKAGLRFGTTKITASLGGTTSGQDGVVDLGQGSVRFKDLYLSGGVYLGGTGSVNKLDDFESGTFNVTLTDGTNSDTKQFAYVKTGDAVHIHGPLGGASYFILSAAGTGAGYDLSFTGSLPYTPQDEGGIVSSSFRAMRCSNGSSMAGNGIMPVLGWRAGSTTMYLDHTKDENSYTSANSVERDSTRTNIVMNFNGWYRTTQ